MASSLRKHIRRHKTMPGVWIGEEGTWRKQAERTPAEYYVELRALCQEIDFYEDFQVICGPNAKKYQSKVENCEYSIFLQALIRKFDQTRPQILGRDPFPTLMQSIFVCRGVQEKCHVTVSASRMVSLGHCSSMRKTENWWSRKWKKKCDYCWKSGHTRDRCWTLHGRPLHGHGGRNNTFEAHTHVFESVYKSIASNDNLIKGQNSENSDKSLFVEVLQLLKRLTPRSKLHQLQHLYIQVYQQQVYQQGFFPNSHSWIIVSGALSIWQVRTHFFWNISHPQAIIRL